MAPVRSWPGVTALRIERGSLSVVPHGPDEPDARQVAITGGTFCAFGLAVVSTDLYFGFSLSRWGIGQVFFVIGCGILGWAGWPARQRQPGEHGKGIEQPDRRTSPHDDGHQDQTHT